MPVIALGTPTCITTLNSNNYLSSFIGFVLLPVYRLGNGDLGFLLKSISWNANASHTDFKVFVPNFFQANLLPMPGNVFFLLVSTIMLCFCIFLPIVK